jgi:RimJ/RimL family protein N-acetyltransferase
MLTIQQTTDNHLGELLAEPLGSSIDGFLLPIGEEVAPRFVLERMRVASSQDPTNSFWWLPWLVIVNKSVVGMCGFKSPPNDHNSVEIGYGMVTSQQGNGFATQAVHLLVQAGFARDEIRSITAATIPSNAASIRVLEKNQFGRDGRMSDPEDGEVLLWRRTR